METLIAQLAQIKGALPASYSRIHCLEQCPRKFDLMYVHKPKDPVIRKVMLETAAGTIIHRAFEACGKSNKPVSKDTFKQIVSHTSSGYRSDIMAYCDSIADVAYDTYCKTCCMTDPYSLFLTEQQFAYNKNWKIYQPNTVFPKDAAWYGFADVVIKTGDVISLVDYKTEARTVERDMTVTTQTDLYAEAIFDTYPDVSTLSTYVAYVLDRGVIKKADYSRETLEALRNKNKSVFRHYLNELLGRAIFEPKKGDHCKWCKFNNGFGCNA